MQVLEALQGVVDVHNLEMPQLEDKLLWKQVELLGMFIYQSSDTEQVIPKMPNKVDWMKTQDPRCPEYTGVAGVEELLASFDFAETGAVDSDMLMLIGQVHMRVSGQSRDWTQDMNQKLLSELDPTGSNRVKIAALAHHLNQSMVGKLTELEAVLTGLSELACRLGRQAVLWSAHSIMDFDDAGFVPLCALIHLKEATMSSAGVMPDEENIASSHRFDSWKFVHYFNSYLPQDRLQFEEIAAEFLHAAQRVVDPRPIDNANREESLQVIFDAIDYCRFVPLNEAMELLKAYADQATQARRTSERRQFLHSSTPATAEAVQTELWTDEMFQQILLELDPNGSGVVTSEIFVGCLNQALPADQQGFQAALFSLMTITSDKFVGKVQQFYLQRGMPHLAQKAAEQVKQYQYNHSKLWFDLHEKYPPVVADLGEELTRPKDRLAKLQDELLCVKSDLRASLHTKLELQPLAASLQNQLHMQQAECEELKRELELVSEERSSIVRVKDLDAWEEHLKEHREWNAAQQTKLKLILEAGKEHLDSNEMTKYKRDLHRLQKQMVGSRLSIDHLLDDQKRHETTLKALIAERDHALEQLQPLREGRILAAEGHAAAEAKNKLLTDEVRTKCCRNF